MASGRGDAFEDRGQSQKPANPMAGARNQGGFQNAPKEPKVGPVAPPPVSRARKDSVLRPVGDGGSSSGGGVRGGAPPSPPPNRLAQGNATGTRGPTLERGGENVGIGSARQQDAGQSRQHGAGGPVAPPAPRAKDGGWTAEQRAEWNLKPANPGGGSLTGPKGTSGVDAQGKEFNNPAAAGGGTHAGGGSMTGPNGTSGVDGAGKPFYSPDQKAKWSKENPGAAAGQKGVMATNAPETAPTPGSVAPADAQREQSTAQMPPSSPANAGARKPQGPEEMGAAMTESGNPLPTPDAQPPQNDPEVAAGMPSPEESASSFNEAVGEAGPDSFGGRMGEGQLGIKIEQSDQIPNGKEWKGEIGPGMASNSAGGLGIPGQQNSPEDVAFNRGRFDSALKQNKGDKHAAAMSAGAFPSGNPIAHGTMDHMKRLVESTDGDGVDVGTMDEGTRRRYKADAVRQMEEYGAYPGMDDPDSPAPPVRPLSWSYNPHSNKMVSPEGAESYIDRFGGGKGAV